MHQPEPTNAKASAIQSDLWANEANFRVLTDAMPQMVWWTRPDGYADYYNARWYEFTGLPQGSTFGEDWNGVYHSDDREQAWETWRRSLDTGEPYEGEYRLRSRDGDYRWTLGRAVPVRGARNEITRWIGTCTEIDQAKRDANRAELLNRDLSHRIRNIFAVIGGLIGLSAFGNPANKAFATDLAARIAALGRAHNFARPHTDESRPYADETRIQGLLAELLRPYASPAGAEITIGGEDPPIDDRSATPMALVIHELATNAAKFGALSVPEGVLQIAVRHDGQNIMLSWQERGGPPIASPPEQTGFGSELAEVSVEDQLGGRIERRWNPDGLTVELTIPAERLGAVSPDA